MFELDENPPEILVILLDAAMWQLPKA